jgi:hypothetical protein
MSAPRKNNSDPMWDARRKRLDLHSVVAWVLISVSVFHGVEMATVVVPAAMIYQASILGLYFGVVGYERVRLNKGDGDASVV